MSSAAIDLTDPMDYRSKYQLAANACPISYDITSADQDFGDQDADDDGNLSYLYALGSHWLLYWASFSGGLGDLKVLNTDGVTTTIYTLDAMLVPSSGKLVSDGTNIWAAVSVADDYPNPYQIDYTDKCADFIHFARQEHDSDTWFVEAVQVYHSTGGAFSAIGEIDAKFNNLGGGAFGGDANGMVGRLEGAASENEPGVAYFGWSEAGYTGSQFRRASAEGGNSGVADPCCTGDCPNTGKCGCPNPELRLSDNVCHTGIDAHGGCRDGGGTNPTNVLPTFPDSTFPGPVGDEYPDFVGDWSWFGMRFAVIVCDDASVTDELEPIGYMKSVNTIHYGNDFYDDGQIFEPTVIVPDGALMVMNEAGPVAFTIFPTSSDHSVSDFVPGTEVTMNDLTTMTVLETLGPSDAVPTSGRTIANLQFNANQGGSLAISRVPYVDPIDSADIYYVGSFWVQDNASVALNVHRVPTDGGGPFEPFDLNSALASVITANPQAGTVMPELWNTWVFLRNTTSDQRLERHCPRGWIGDGPSHVPDVYELALIDDAIYYGSTLLAWRGVRKLCLCRLCAPCPGQSPFILLESPFTEGEEFDEGADPVPWTVMSCSDSITTVEFLVDDVVLCTATNPVGNLFYYCDSAPGNFDVGGLSAGDHDLCWNGYDVCGELIETNCVTITINAVTVTGVVFKVNGTQLAALDTVRTTFRNLFIRADTITQNDHWFGDITIGTTGYGSSDIFSEDWSSANFAAGGWSSSDPDGLWTFASGRLHAIGTRNTASSSARKDIGSNHALPVYIRISLQVDANELADDNGLYFNFYANNLFAEIGGVYLYQGNLGFYTDQDFLDCDISCPFALVAGDVITIDIGIFGP